MTNNETLKHWRNKNPDKVLEQNKRAYIKHKTDVNKRCKEYYVTNKDYRRQIMYFKKYGLEFGQYDK